VYLGLSNLTTDESDTGNPFQFSPTRDTELPSQTHDVPNLATDRDRLHILDPARRSQNAWPSVAHETVNINSPNGVHQTSRALA
jgi:hypothetical protein